MGRYVHSSFPDDLTTLATKLFTLAKAGDRNTSTSLWITVTDLMMRQLLKCHYTATSRSLAQASCLTVQVILNDDAI